MIGNHQARLTAQDFTPQELTFIGNSEIFIGRKYKKAIYVEYIDDTFTVKKPKGEVSVITNFDE
jgi:hypothetical protein